jgi:ATP/maltotriose-dependent transcriptional regulator MalT
VTADDTARERLSLITDIVKACGDELQAARAERSEAARRVVLLRGELAKALADHEAAEMRVTEASEELGRWWPEFKDVVTARAREVAAVGGETTQAGLALRS